MEDKNGFCKNLLTKTKDCVPVLLCDEYIFLTTTKWWDENKQANIEIFPPCMVEISHIAKENRRLILTKKIR